MSVLLQINVSRGGIPKRPIPAAMLTPLGLEGDEHANPQIHGGPDQAVLIMTAETIDELVARDGDQPRDREVGDFSLADRSHRREEGLPGEILGDGRIADTRREVSVDLGKRTVVQREQPRTLVGGGALVHAVIIVRRPRAPTARVQEIRPVSLDAPRVPARARNRDAVRW